MGEGTNGEQALGSGASPQRKLHLREADVRPAAADEAAVGTPARAGVRGLPSGPPSVGSASHQGAGTPLRATPRSPHASGPQTFGRKYMAFAAGFANMADGEGVYRTARLHMTNPTAAATEDMSYYYTLDSGRTPPSALAAHPNSSREHVRNTGVASRGGTGGTMKGLWKWRGAMSSSLDLDAFASERFDAKAYVNQACVRRGDGPEPLDRLGRTQGGRPAVVYLGELEMKLHLAAEDVALYLQDHSGCAMARIPAAARELDDAQGVRAAAAAALRQLDERGGDAAPAVAALAQLDAVKCRMEAACSTLKEAAGLSALFQRVDDLFAAGDLERVAEALAGMARGLAVVGDSVAEFRGGRQRLARLEERFAAAVEAPLAAAFAAQKGEEARQLCGYLAAARREEVAERLYCAARLAPLQALWDSYAPPTPFVAWLPGFYDQAGAGRREGGAARAVRGEAEWLASALPGHCPGFLLSLLCELLAALERPYRQRLGGAMAAPPGSVLPLERLEQAAAAARGWAAQLADALADVGVLTPAEFAGALYARVLAPAEEVLGQYADRELGYLTAELQAVARGAAGEAAAARAAGGAAGEGAAACLGAAIPPAAAALAAALARCLRLTGGTGLPALARVADRAAAQFVATLEAGAAALRRPRGGEAAAAGEPDLDAAEVAVPLLAVAAQLRTVLAQAEADLRAAAAHCAPRLLAAAAAAEGVEAVLGEGGLPDAAALRLSRQPELRQQLAALGGAPAGAGLLPLASAAAADMERGVGVHVEDVLTARVRAQLAGLPSLPEWQQRQGALPLPTFSAYPLQYVTSTGEYLMMLPQLLESALLLAEEGGAEEGAAHELVASWIDRVALSSARLYLQRLSGLRGLTPQGTVQLAADLEYFCNVLTTLGVEVPPALAAWQAAAAVPAAAFPDVAAAAAEGGAPEAQAAVELVARLRGLAPSHAQ
eukprot:scaffold12.g7905.t1